MKQYLKISEFAKICNTTKDTLLHYDRKGILKPRIVMGNGYRYYNIAQWTEFDLISLLKESGSTLDEIKSYKKNTACHQAFFNEKLKALKDEKNRIVRRISLMERMVLASKDLARKPGIITFEKNEKIKTFACYPVVKQKDTLQNFGDFVDVSLEHRNVLELPLGMTVTKDSVERGKFLAETVFYGRAKGKKENQGCQIKKMPEGLYAVMLYDAEVASFGSMLSKMLTYIKNSGYTADERFFLFDLINFITFEGKNYTAKIMIRVTKTHNED